MGQLEELVLAEQQTALVRQVIGRLTEMAFDSCIAKPSSALSSSEQSCIQVRERCVACLVDFGLGRGRPTPPMPHTDTTTIHPPLLLFSPLRRRWPSTWTRPSSCWAACSARRGRGRCEQGAHTSKAGAVDEKGQRRTYLFQEGEKQKQQHQHQQQQRTLLLFRSTPCHASPF